MWTSFTPAAQVEALSLCTGKDIHHSLLVSFTKQPVLSPLSPPSSSSSLQCSAAGISRSVTITVMYMMTVSEHSFEECLAAVRMCREVANPNFGFRLQLQKYAEGKLKQVLTLLVFHCWLIYLLASGKLCVCCYVEA